MFGPEFREISKDGDPVNQRVAHTQRGVRIIPGDEMNDRLQIGYCLR